MKQFFTLLALLFSLGAWADGRCGGELTRRKLSQKETQQLFKSLVDRYIQETGASTLLRSFKTGPRSSQYGEKRLVVALSENSWKVYKKYFSRPEFLIHVHDPGQGTLSLAHEGKAGSYASLRHTFGFPEVGALLPHILLSTSEGLRARQYFRLGALMRDGKIYKDARLGGGQETRYVREPWLMTSGLGNPYCAMGGYNSCTHWFGNIPLGDELVDAYAFPGKVDEHASNQVGRKAQIAPLQKYDLSPNLKPEIARLIRKVWTVPGHQQLADVLGCREENLRGEFANPGYVAHVLLSRTEVERVPVVFYVVEDHKAPIPPRFDPQIDAY